MNSFFSPFIAFYCRCLFYHENILMEILRKVNNSTGGKKSQQKIISNPALLNIFNALLVKKIGGYRKINICTLPPDVL
jgi:hypothetical protein